MDFDQAFDRLIGFEGGYSYSPSDPGGETMWGVTRRVAQANGYFGDMHVLPRETAKAIYKKQYWGAIQADQIPPSLRYDAFDAAVNSGVTQSTKWLQRVAHVGEDGVMGALTITALAELNGPTAAAVFNGLRLDFMTSLPTWGAFSRGWARRIAANLQAIQ